MDIRLALMTGSDIPIPQCQLIMKQPTIEEIGFVGESDFFIGVQSLSLYKNMFSQDENVLREINNFQLFMTIMMEKETADKKKSVLEVFKIIFPKYKAIFTPQSLLFQGDDGTKVIDQDNFEMLQENIRKVFCASNGPMDQQAFNPANAKAKEIADKLMRGRQRVAQLNNNANVSIFSQYLSILSIGLHKTPNELKKLTMYQLYDLMERFSLWSAYDIDTKVRLAGGKPDNQPDNWMKNIH